MVRLGVGEPITDTVATFSSASPVKIAFCSLFSYRVNAEGKFVYIKYHFLADDRRKQFTTD
ncbi:uncharacterized protein N7477_004222 [Penicillium maclennaniae]|uniref:uncharacterized protein n=1 Tax=Penicillium maclennaniae TaxID=1343394 RepID=UPI00253FF86E|nr:uncharacterized protein N7477_004222 [Penicillium maclennaniae]KAJ5674288.1 hypothetical protein N7477_004222 [Penicillium maclennaniae]